jgi:hypothetical protein
MKINMLKTSFAVILLLALALASLAQDPVVTKKEVVVNPDGTYTVIEYPVGKEVTVSLVPSATFTGGKGTARIIRSADGTKILLDATGIPATTTNVYAYAIDPSGMPTLLGPVTVENGIARAEFTTPLNQFMLALSPLENLTGLTPTNVVFHSAVPSGYTIVPRKMKVGGDKYVAVAGTSQFAYEVPLLNVPSFNMAARKASLEFGSDYSGLKAEAEIRPEKGVTKISLNMENMKRAPAGTRIVLWARDADGKYIKLGQVINSGKRDDTTIKSETALTDFGLFMTVESAEVELPSGKVYSVFRIS